MFVAQIASALASQVPRTATAIVLAFVVLSSTLHAPSSAAARNVCSSSAAALDNGLNAYVKGDYPAARTFFECIIEHGDEAHRLYARFYLGRIFADNNGTETNHAKAYALFSDISGRHAETADPDNPRIAPFVARALTTVGTYVLRGVTDAGVRADSAKAVELLRYAATFYDEPDAQFELSKLMLIGDGVRTDPELALHYLGKLSKRNHAAAQAFLASLLWSGKFVKQDQITSLALSELAVKNAQAADRLWIEDIHQNIYCGTATGVRKQSSGLVARWSQTFQRAPNRNSVDNPTPDLEPTRRLSPERTCANGESIGARGAERGQLNTQPSVNAATTSPAIQPTQQVGVQTLVPRDR